VPVPRMDSGCPGLGSSGGVPPGASQARTRQCCGGDGRSANVTGADACGAGASARRAGGLASAQHTASTATACRPCGRSGASVAGADACGTGASARRAGGSAAAQHTASTATACRPRGRPGASFAEADAFPLFAE